VDLWQGWPGREHGEEGLIRSAARRYSRQLHNGLSLASQKLNERSFPTRDGRVGWAPSVILEGRVRRRIGSLMGGRVATPRYAEMYVHDAMFGQHSADVEEPAVVTASGGQRIVLPRSTSAPDRSRVRGLFTRLFEYVRRVNSYVISCVCAAEECMNMDVGEMEHAVLLIRGKRSRADQMASQRNRSQFAVNAGHHGRLGGLAEMCVVCPRHLAQEERSAVLVNLRAGGLTDVPIEHRSFDALYHVLLHPTGHEGWEDGLSRRPVRVAWATLPEAVRTSNWYAAAPTGSSAFNPKDKVSLREYYAYVCHYRRGGRRTDNCKFMMGRLFQEYLCVAFWRVEAFRLQIHRMAQENMRQAHMSELRYFAHQVRRGETPDQMGRVYYMPESFIGGPADMYAKYQDAMTSVHFRGAASLFITMTANPGWPEVQRSLAYAQTAQDRADVIARVFNAKLNALLADIKAGALGRHAATVHVIEFQKRGLPHAHIVVVLVETDRPRTAAQIDALSSAELPPLPEANDNSRAAVAQRRLRALVLEHMVHNDCTGPNGPRCPCWDSEKGKCGGNFPFAFVQDTTMGDERRRSVLRRRHGAPWTATINGRQVTNQWVVPYNAALLLKFQCHLNVEVVTAAYAYKYLYKYVPLQRQQAVVDLPVCLFCRVAGIVSKAPIRPRPLCMRRRNSSTPSASIKTIDIWDLQKRHGVFWPFLYITTRIPSFVWQSLCLNNGAPACWPSMCVLAHLSTVRT
jgi:hypothetical protein